MTNTGESESRQRPTRPASTSRRDFLSVATVVAGSAVLPGVASAALPLGSGDAPDAKR